MPHVVLTVEGREISNPSWEKVREALELLDGETCSMITLEKPGTSSLFACGGNGGRYLIMYLPDSTSGESFMASDPTADGPGIELCAGGQWAAYPARWCHPLSNIVTAFQEFYSGRELTPALTWEKG